jgi:uncharacterized protein (TIGR02145 family)
MKIKIKTLCWGMIPDFLFSLVLLVTSCQQEDIATVTTNSITDITQATATAGGNVTADGGAIITAKGVCWSTTQNPIRFYSSNYTTDGSGTGSFRSFLTGLTVNTTYYVRAYAYNSQGIAYGSQVSFTTNDLTNCGTVTDIDGNTYKTILIGTQCWMRENLKTTKYLDGAAIPNVTDNATWGSLTTGAYCWYKNDIGNKATYGALYNWYAVNTGKLCPTGWHVPSDAEWTTLSTYIVESFFGGFDMGGGGLGRSMKETGTTHWASPNEGATNKSGFSGLPGGYRFEWGDIEIGYSGYWWSSTEDSSITAWNRYISVYATLNRDSFNKRTGFSVRCLRDL